MTQHDQCQPGQHPRTCTADKLSMDIKLYSQWPHGLPSKCPTSRPGRTCIKPPLAPIAYAETCVKYGVPFHDAVAMIPAWVLDLDGGIVGTKSRPWRPSEYVLALLQARSGKVVGDGEHALAHGLFEIPGRQGMKLFTCDKPVQEAVAAWGGGEAMEIDLQAEPSG
ncbi:hypothetical protein LTR36_000608 [Oleoguttula mirabilis]|uniref:Uncharacterized protein n=1 Tax=Oleoguttula mirabilis TaxID=1507867 RepID=A0AAV9JPZ4_9PEZI|nr:hypothetical protein LTR36_000608 [Oleoguttula mirabilis]